MVLESVVGFLVESIGSLGYIGIFVLMALESSFFPFPSEVVIIPAGYLAFQGKMNLGLVVLFGVLGSLVGAWFNYFLANRYGRRIIFRIFPRHRLTRVEKFFKKHGHISTFNGRLIPIVRQYISFPAGLARMDGWKFSLYTGLGAGIWVLILALLGYFLGANETLIVERLKEITILILVLVALVSFFYVLRLRRGKKVSKNNY